MGEMVEFASNGGTAHGYLATPEGSGPGVVVIQEWWGLVSHIKDVADRFAAEGFVALAPDLYHGRSTTEPDEANKLLMNMQMEQAAKDMSGAVAYLKGRDEVAPKKVGVIGFCAGGGLALKLAGITDVDACAPFYAFFVPDEATVASLTMPVQGHFAEHDQSTEGAEPLFSKLREAGRDAEFFVYPGTEHAFFNDDRPGVHDEAASAQAWDRVLTFFRKHLAG
jgi:carboxymethylenebutenolidase